REASAATPSAEVTPTEERLQRFFPKTAPPALDPPRPEPIAYNRDPGFEPLIRSLLLWSAKGRLSHPRVIRLPAADVHAALEFGRSRWLGDALALGLGSDCQRQVPGYLANVGQRRQQAAVRIGAHRRQGTERPGCRQEHLIGDRPGSARDHSQSHSG